MKTNRTAIFSLIAVVAVVAVAAEKIIGVWSSASGGPQYAGQTFDTDQFHDFQAANAIFLNYVLPQMRNPLTVNAIIKWDYFRVVYFDGKIADFKILNAAPSMDGLSSFKFSKLAATAKSPPPGGKPKGKSYIPNSYCPKSVVTEYETGFWGWTQEAIDNADGGLPTIRISQSWNSTGPVVVNEKMPPDNCK